MAKPRKTIRAGAADDSPPGPMADELRAAAEAAEVIDPRLAEKLRAAAKTADELAAVMRAALAGLGGRQTR